MLITKALDNHEEMRLSAVKHSLQVYPLKSIASAHQAGLRAHTGVQPLKHKRYPDDGVIPMTIALGFRCVDGLVLGADSQFEEGEDKYDGDKLFSIPAPDNSGVLITGAGDFDAIRHCVRFLKDQGLVGCGSSLIDIKTIICNFIAGKNYATLLKCSGTFEMIVGIRSGTERATELLYICQQKISPEQRFKIIGSGSSISRFFSKYFWNPYMTIEMFSPFLLSIIKAAKINHVGVDGQTKVLGLPNENRPDKFTYLTQDEFLWGTFESLQKALLCAQNPGTSREDFEESLKVLLDGLNRRWLLSRPRD
jgi:20S proteasome alpha/beta subunit